MFCILFLFYFAKGKLWWGKERGVEHKKDMGLSFFIKNKKTSYMFLSLGKFKRSLQSLGRRPCPQSALWSLAFVPEAASVPLRCNASSMTSLPRSSCLACSVCLTTTMWTFHRSLASQTGPLPTRPSSQWSKPAGLDAHLPLHQTLPQSCLPALNPCSSTRLPAATAQSWQSTMAMQPHRSGARWASSSSEYTLQSACNLQLPKIVGRACVGSLCWVTRESSERKRGREEERS